MSPLSFPFDDELGRVALVRALRDLPAAALADGIARARAYADAGILAWSGDDDAEAVRRSRLYRAHVAPCPALQLMDSCA